MNPDAACTCGSTADRECPDCHQALCIEHSCSQCSRCEADCLCRYMWWTPDLFI